MNGDPVFRIMFVDDEPDVIGAEVHFFHGKFHIPAREDS